MNKPFIITGLPRSRTAWLAAVVNLHDDAFCLHEPTAWMGRWEDITRILTEPQMHHMGASDASLGLHLPWIVERTDALVLIVERDPNDVLTSLWRLNPLWADRRYVEVLKRRLDAFDHPNVLRVPYAALAVDTGVMAALRHILPGSPHIEFRKLAAMQRMNIQACPKLVAEGVQRRTGEFAAILGHDVIEEMAHG